MKIRRYPTPPHQVLFPPDLCLDYAANVQALGADFTSFGNEDGTDDYLYSRGEEWSPDATKTTVEGPPDLCPTLGTVISDDSGSPAGGGFRFMVAASANVWYPGTWWLSVWFFVYNLGAALASEGQRIITLTHNGTSSKWRVGWNTDGVLRYSGGTSVNIATLESNRWYNLIMCKKTAGSNAADFDIYLDGELKVNQSLTNASPSNHDWWIGNQAGVGGTSGRPLRGGIYGLAFGADSVLDQDDVNAILGL